MRTAAWYLRQTSVPELFSKPDDRWEVNEVSNRCPDVVEAMREGMNQYHQAVETGRIDQLPPLPEVLVTGVD
jgi:hypothetical protein